MQRSNPFLLLACIAILGACSTTKPSDLVNNPGQNTGGSATGGSQATGGDLETGGNQATGGAAPSGGTDTTGGIVGAGGAITTGGCLVDDCTRVCDEDCSNHGACIGESCVCDDGYVGDACNACAPELHFNADATLCISELCDPDPCQSPGQTCDNSDGSCCSALCVVGATECNAGAMTTCVQTISGCSDWSLVENCDMGTCLCNAAGDVSIMQWSTGEELTLRALIVSNDGMLVSAGASTKSLPGQPETTESQPYLRAQTISDNETTDVWSHQWGTPEYDFVHGAAQTPTGAWIVVGGTNGKFTQESPGNTRDGFATFWNADGSRGWDNQWGTSFLDEARAVAVGNNAIYVAGYATDELVNTYAGDDDVILRKLNFAGEVQWMRQWGTAQRDYALAVAANSKGHVWIGGRMDGDAFCSRLNEEGEVLWTYIVAPGTKDFVTDIALLPGDGVILTAYLDRTTGGQVITRIDGDGKMVWEDKFGVVYGGSAHAVTLGHDGDLYITGYAREELVKGQYAGGLDVYAQRRTVDGLIVWTKQFGTDKDDYARAIAVDSDAVYVGLETFGAFPGYVDRGGMAAAIIRIPN